MSVTNTLADHKDKYRGKVRLDREKTGNVHPIKICENTRIEIELFTIIMTS